MRILKITSLPKSTEWVDRDYVLLHVNFQVLSDFYEKEFLGSYKITADDLPEDYFEFKESYDVQLAFNAEVKALYDWWQERKKTIYSEDEDSENIDQQMLIRLINIRKCLWT